MLNAVYPISLFACAKRQPAARMRYHRGKVHEGYAMSTDVDQAGMEGDIPVLQLEFSRSFEAEKRDLVDHLSVWGQGDRSIAIDLERFESSVILKNSQRVIVQANAAFKSMMTGGGFAAGSKTDGLLANRSRHVSHTTDDLVISGVRSLEMEHVCHDGYGQLYEFVTFKRRLDELQDPNLCFVAMFRALSVAKATPFQRRLSLSEQLAIFRELDETDQRICQLYNQGEPTKAIAAAVGLATRSVELRRQKVMETFGFEKTVEVVKLLTRLEEHDLIRNEK